MSPQNPKDNELSLKPSSSVSAGTTGSPDFSDVQGHVDTVPAASRSPEFADVQGHTDTVPAGVGQTYTVRKGDTLSQIAHDHYGKASRWHAIFEANRDQIDDPDKIRPGQVLNLPPQD
ncbi:MAG TPA: LysM peptidoglycan-binding domain-containing protein [Luteimonas sp.]|nr:LysM peptidoglycan-binding domain-containing protein [Luteimonas sp.]